MPEERGRGRVRGGTRPTMQVIADALGGSACHVGNCAVGCVYWNGQVNANSLVISVAEKPVAPPRGQPMRPPFAALGLLRSRQRAVSGHIPLLTAARHHPANWSAPLLLLPPWASHNGRASAGAAPPTDCRGHRSGVIGSGKRCMRGGRLCDLTQEITSIAQF
jgi:hypothetical protein